MQRILARAEHPAGVHQLEVASLPLGGMGNHVARRPGTAVTMARRVPVRRLKRVDFPTLGRPTSTTEAVGERFEVVTFAPQRSSFDSVSGSFL